MNCYVLRTNGTVEKVDELLDGESFKALYEAIGCSMVERAQLHPMGEMWVDEDACFKVVQTNFIATEIFAKHSRLAHNPNTGIQGDVYLRLKDGWTLTDDGVLKNF